MYAVGRGEKTKAEGGRSARALREFFSSPHFFSPFSCPVSPRRIDSKRRKTPREDEDGAGRTLARRTGRRLLVRRRVGARTGHGGGRCFGARGRSRPSAGRHDLLERSWLKRAGRGRWVKGVLAGLRRTWQRATEGGKEEVGELNKRAKSERLDEPEIRNRSCERPSSSSNINRNSPSTPTTRELRDSRDSDGGARGWVAGEEVPKRRFSFHSRPPGAQSDEGHSFNGVIEIAQQSTDPHPSIFVLRIHIHLEERKKSKVME